MKPLKKLLKWLNYALLINACLCFGYSVVNAVYFQQFNLMITITTVVSMALFMSLVKVEQRFNTEE